VCHAAAFFPASVAALLHEVPTDFSYVVPWGGISVGKWRSSFVGSYDGKMNVQSACALNT
jgi:hypothetical protein